MTLEDAIKKFEQKIGEFEKLKKLHAVTYEDYEYIEKTEQLAEWLKELKERRRRMNIYEAIDILKANYPDACYEQLIEAVDTAISALQAQEVKHSKELSSTNKALDTIDRQDAIDAVSRGCEECRGIYARCEANLLALPSAQPEIIRCRDCKHYNAGFECLIEGYGIERSADWYCGDAERRENDKR